MSVINVIDFAPDLNAVHQSALAVQICIGLLNRKTSQQYYSLNSNDGEDYDSSWMTNILSLSEDTTNIMTVEELLEDCYKEEIVNGYIRYDYTNMMEVMPNLITLAAVLDAVILEDGADGTDELEMVFDATVEWDGFGAHEATEYMFTNHMSDCSTAGIAKT